jgi:hypothetical protein
MNKLMQLQEKAGQILIKAKGQKGRLEIYQKYKSNGDEYQRDKKLFNQLMLEYKKIINEIQILVYEKYV